MVFGFEGPDDIADDRIETTTENAAAFHSGISPSDVRELFNQSGESDQSGSGTLGSPWGIWGLAVAALAVLAVLFGGGS